MSQKTLFKFCKIEQCTWPSLQKITEKKFQKKIEREKKL